MKQLPLSFDQRQFETNIVLPAVIRAAIARVPVAERAKTQIEVIIVPVSAEACCVPAAILALIHVVHHVIHRILAAAARHVPARVQVGVVHHVADEGGEPGRAIAAQDPAFAGLSTDEAKARLAREGPNEVAVHAGASVLPQLWASVANPLLGILLAGAFGILLVLRMVVARRYQQEALMVFMPYGPFLILSAFFIVFLPNWLVVVVPK